MMRRSLSTESSISPAAKYFLDGIVRPQRPRLLKRRVLERQMALEAPARYAVVDFKGIPWRIAAPYVYEFRLKYELRKNRRLTVRNFYEREIGIESNSDTMPAKEEKYLVEAIRNGLVKVNESETTQEYELKTGDKLYRMWHRHEFPVLFVPVKDMVLEVTEDIVAVNKPPTIPVHGGGHYRLNSLLYILRNEFLEGQGDLFPIHRLDRLTSGLILLGRTSEGARRVAQYIQNKKGLSMRKTYVARVRGHFPSDESGCAMLPGLVHIGYASLSDNGAQIQTVEGSKPPDQNVMMSDSKQVDPREGADDTCSSSASTIRDGKRLNQPLWVTISLEISHQSEVKAGSAAGANHDPNEMNTSTVVTTTIGDDGAELAPLGSEPSMRLSKRTATTETKGSTGKACIAGGEDDEGTGGGDGVEGGKASTSRFRLLSYDQITNTSLVQCEPVTGRTHQLRIHLQAIGFPIANDPKYGGDEPRPVLDDDETVEFDSLSRKAIQNLPPNDTSGLRAVAISICPDCTERFAPISLTGIWLHACRVRLYNKDVLQKEYRAPLPEWAMGGESEWVESFWRGD